ncbi:DUF362 domain-containing protein [Planctomycetota bacterium]
MKNQKPPTVALARCNDYNQQNIDRNVLRIFELLGGIQKFIKPGDSVLLKPNFIAPKSRRCATQTDPALIIAIAKILKDFGAKPFVGDSPAWSTAAACADKLKLTETLKKMAVPITQLDKPRKCKTGHGRIPISSIALDADVVINLPKFKSHQQLIATFAVKNMFGTVSGKAKAYLHFARGGVEHDFCKLLIDVYKTVNPALTIIDAITVMDGPGPINGRPRPLGWLIAGIDPIACETICAELIDLDPSKLPIIKTARKMAFGCSKTETIDVVGDDFKENICTDFQPAQLIPIRFSLLHVCKSIAKQLLLITKNAFAKPKNTVKR